MKSNSVAGLEIILLPDGSYELYLVILKKQKNTLVTENQAEQLHSFAEAKKLIDPKTPVVLIINGKGVIHRKVRRTENDTNASLLSKCLPNAVTTDFALQQLPLNADEVFVSIIRTDILKDILQQLIKHQLTSISSCFLGPFVLTNVLPLLEKEVISHSYVYVHQFRLQFYEQQIISLEVAAEPSMKQYRIGNEQLSARLLTAFAGAVSYFTQNENNISNTELLDELKKEFKQKQKFELRGWAALIITFLILIVNYLFFNYYWTKNKEMNAELELTQVALQRYTKLKSDYDQKRLFLEQNGLLENSRTSYYADQLAKALPASIQFTGLNIHPQKKKKVGEEDNGFFFETKIILISGNCKRNTELNEWMKQMKKQNWVENFTLLNYRQDNANEDGVFLIEVKLK